MRLGLRRPLRGSDSSSRTSRGQSLVEFALILPVLLLLVLMVLDFGRVYLGYINLQNVARIAANYAANNPTTWSATAAKYRQEAVNDAKTINCDNLQVADPVFADTNGDGSTTSVGDTVTVGVSCKFHLITPGMQAVFGGSVIPVSADAIFPVKSGMSATGGATAPPGSAPNAAFMGNSVVADTTTTPTLTGVTPFTVDFNDTSGGAPASWAWNFGTDPGGSVTPSTSTAQDIPGVQFFCTVASCTFNVSMTASNGYGSSTAHMTVVVNTAPTVDFSFTPTSPNKLDVVTFTSTATAGATSYTWAFGDGQTATGASTTHAYSSSGTFTVKLTVAYPAPTGNVSVSKSLTVSSNCTVPGLDGVKFNDAQAVWSGAGFMLNTTIPTGEVQRDTGAPNGNFKITAQTLTATSVVPCTSNVKVTGK